MRLTKSGGSKTGKALVTSQVSTVLLSFLPQVELLKTSQFVCRKWHNKFVASIVQKIVLRKELTGKVFRLKMKGAQGSTPQYMATTFNQHGLDHRNGANCYCSVGNSKLHTDFRWKYLDCGAIVPANRQNYALAALRVWK